MRATRTTCQTVKLVPTTKIKLGHQMGWMRHAIIKRRVQADSKNYAKI